jgi:type VII secretion protein EccE
MGARDMGARQALAPARSRAGRFGAAQAVTVELAAMVAAGGFYALPLPLAVGVAAAMVVVAGLAVIRMGGRWWYEAIGAWLRLRRRRHAGSLAARAARPAGPYRVELAALAPYLSIETILDRNVAIGIGTDELGWFAAIAVSPPDTLSGADGPSASSRAGADGPSASSRAGDGALLRLDWLARVVADASAAPTAVQIVVRHAPLPSAVIDPRSACALSYQELRATLGAPPQRDLWIAVRLGLDDGVAAADDGGGLAGIHRVLAAALSRVSANLTSHGLDHWVLDGEDLQQALIGAYGPDPYDGRPVRIPPARESWSRWRGVRAVHVSYAVAGLTNPRPDLFAELAHVPGAFSVCTAIAFSPTDTPGRVGARMVVRVIAAPEAITACLRQLRAGARTLRLSLTRLDGEQAAGVYATTPTAAAVGPPW